MLKQYAEDIAKDISEKLLQLGEVKANEGATFKVIATNETKDRDGEIIKVNGWDFAPYMKNPCILANHNYTIESIAGKATRIYIEEENVVIEGVFADTPTGALAAKLYNGGFLKTVSVGFIPKERKQDDYRVITRAELLEVSFVPVPSNPTALSLDQKSLKLAKDAGLLTTETDKTDTPPEAVPTEELVEEVKGLRADIAELKELITAKKEKENMDFEIKQSMQIAERAVSE